MRQKAELRPMRPTRLSCGALFARLGLLLVLLCAQHGALLHAYSHFGLVPDPYAVGDRNAPPAEACDLGIVHCALDASPPSLTLDFPSGAAAPLALRYLACAFTPRALPAFHSRAPPVLS